MPPQRMSTLASIENMFIYLVNTQDKKLKEKKERREKKGKIREEEAIAKAKRREEKDNTQKIILESLLDLAARVKKLESNVKSTTKGSTEIQPEATEFYRPQRWSLVL